MIKSFYQQTRNHISNLPLITWVLLGFFITFLFFFISPIFFYRSQIMQFNEYVPAMKPIGDDFRIIVSASSAWLHTGTPPITLYPSFALIFFSPFAFLDYETGYKIIAAIIIFCYFLITFVLPQRINKSNQLSAFTMLIFVTGIVSYGFQFELERGQWNIIAFAFTMTAIYLFHNRPKHRWLSYLLFTISIQLKLYPAIFVFCFIEDWSDWKGNIRRVVSLGLVNILALFILGSDPILKTIQALEEHISYLKTGPVEGNAFNTSITSFTMYILKPGSLHRKLIVLWLMENNWTLQVLLYAFFASCFAVILRQEYKKNSLGFRPCVFLACAIGACVIPSVSFDYKLSLLPACIAVSIPSMLPFEKKRNRFLLSLLAFVFAIAYSSTLYSYTNKPKLLHNNLPALLLILLLCTILSLMKSDLTRQTIADALVVDLNVQ